METLSCSIRPWVSESCLRSISSRNGRIHAGRRSRAERIDVCTRVPSLIDRFEQRRRFLDELAWIVR